MSSVRVRCLLSVSCWALLSTVLAGCGSTNEADSTSVSAGSATGTVGTLSGSGSGSTTGGDGGFGGADLFSPEGIELHPPPIEMPGLTLVAYTLLEGQQGLELYVALRNDSETPACGPSISVDLYDHDGQSLASSVIGVIGGSPYQVVDLPDTYSGCVPPGQVAMAALTDWPDYLTLDAVGHLAYRCPYFEIAVTAIGEFVLSNMERESTGQGDVYRGMLTNQLAITVESPEAIIFPLAASGRPLGIVSVQGSMTLAPADSWVFESPPTTVMGDDFKIFLSASTQSPAD